MEVRAFGNNNIVFSENSEEQKIITNLTWSVLVKLIREILMRNFLSVYGFSVELSIDRKDYVFKMDFLLGKMKYGSIFLMKGRVTSKDFATKVTDCEYLSSDHNTTEIFGKSD